MRAVTEIGGTASADDRLALANADQYIFGHKGLFDLDPNPAVAPAALAVALAGSTLSEEALKFLTVMAFVDGSLDRTKTAGVPRYAAAFGGANCCSRPSPPRCTPNS